MLTRDQLEKLEPLTNHPRYGQILKDAIEVWKQEDVTPIYGWFGISKEFSKEKEIFCFFNPNNKKCCLLGASLIGYKVVNKSDFWRAIDDSIIEKYSISESESCQIWCGFDNTRYYNTEAYDFGNKIRKIVNPISIFT